MHNVDELIKEIVHLRDQAAEHTKLAEGFKQQKAMIEAQLMEIMASMTVSQLGSRHGTASMKLKQVPIIKDWDAFAPFISEHPNILQKRISGPSLAEFLTADIEVPGIEFVEEYTISILRK